MSDQRPSSKFWSNVSPIVAFLSSAGFLVLAVQKGCDYMAAHRAVAVSPPRPLNDGRQSLPYFNAASEDRRVFAAFFVPLQPPEPPGGVGAVESPYVIRFESQHYVANRRHFARWVDDLVLKAGEAGLVLPLLVDPNHAGKRVYGQLTLHYGDTQAPGVVTFPPLWVTVARE